ncbi:26S proteasome subunit RPN9b [Naegleria gruberi]|uniref:26S proteasome subunit RPN9b n=1 Tax=Naegleria gruberi TaxID=5762 RepID=D2V8L8_NAEGR|nr:26S proteasome subunit RPN9b [Naegleria gruberi]EFC46710.1 26S proteasome subunit RPN9b [Naegleria gruberi]|eukprot:XP_002679454.1 26S proteasome subunit RPN9b [Naegleria gruberi strain NEG-M]
MQLVKSDLSGSDLLDFYTNFISSFELKINHLKLGKIVVEISKRLPLNSSEGYPFVEKVFNALSKQDREASCILKIEMAMWKLKESDLTACKRLLGEAKETISTLGFVDNVVNAAYYKTYSNYLKHIDDPNEFYKNELLYLAYTPIEEIPFIEQQSIAFDLGIASLLGDSIYNFGEFLQHPVVESLNGSKAEWLYKFLMAFNKGDIRGYEQLLVHFASEIESRPALNEKRDFLYEKVQLMCLMELVFSKPADDRNISFEEVSAITGKSLDEVEPLLLKALAYNLIRGVIDGVKNSIHVSWAQPRVLDREQISVLSNKLSVWLGKVDETLSFLEKHGSEEIVK